MMADYEQIYETSAVNTGGRDGISYLTDGSYEVKIVTPKEMGGSGDGHNPEELFALGYAACFHAALDAVKAQHKVRNASQVQHAVRLFKRPDAVDFKLEVGIQVGIKDMALDEVQKLAEEANTVCPYSKAISGNVELDLKAMEYDESKER